MALENKSDYSFSRAVKFSRTVACLLVLSFCAFSSLVFAEGSKDLINNGGHRAYFLSTTISSVYNPFPTLGTVKVYVNAGETVYMGSSAQGIGGGTIRVRTPNGNSYDSGTGAANIIGRIDDINEELAGPLPNFGGYDPYTRIVQPGEEGIWEINFISTNVSQGAGGNRNGKIGVLDAWTQHTNSAYISAFDVTVKNSSNMAIPGRAYMDVYGGCLSDEPALFYANFKILTKDGYIYDVNNNGQAGYIFTFFVNNKGFRDGAGNATYKSVNTSTNPPVHDPRLPDSGTDITHKIFFAEPNADLPVTSVIAGGGSTWLLKQPVSPSASNFLFTGVEGTLYKGGTYPLGGTITFEANQAISYSINLDINKNGSFTDAADLTLTGVTTIGINTRHWDGLDGEGNPVLGSLSFNPSNLKITLRGGEIHFPFMDVENNVTGIIIKRTNGVNSPNDVVYWDDDVTGITGGSKQLNGISSTTNGHKWGTTNYRADAFGNERGLDTWTYVESAPINPLMNVELRQADLEVVNLTSNKTTYCVGEEISYTIRLENNGPDDVKGAKIAFNYPAGFEFISVTPTQTTGISTLSGNSSNSTQFTVTADMQNQAVLTLVIKGKTNVPGTLANVSATIMRPADVTDPDATNPDSAVPTDPLLECNSGTPGCNNIKIATSVAVTTRSITIANASVTEKTNALSEIFFPVSIPAISACDVQVNYTITHNTTNAADFDASQQLTGTLLIPAGVRTASIRVLLNADNIIEGNETFTVTISNPIGGYLNNLFATGTIDNDDFGAITVTKTDGAEAGSVAGSFIFRFPSGVTSDVDTEIDYVLSGSSVAGADYAGTATGTVKILAGTNSITLPLPVNDDDIVEGDEKITIALTRLFNAHSGTVSNNSPVTPIINIADNDFGVLTLSDDVVLNETNNGTPTATFTLTLSKATGSYFTLNYATGDLTAKSLDNDYVPSGSVQLNFNGTKDEVKTITIPVNGDTKIEATELFNLLLSNLSDSFSNRLTIPKATGLITITNDDDGIISITKADGEEGINSGTFIFSFPPDLTTDVPIDINYTLTGTAIGAGTDYLGPVTGTVTILPGQNSVALILPVVDDVIVEGIEIIQLTASAASNPYGIVIANSPQTIQIIDNDVANLTISPASTTETNSGTPVMIFDVTLSEATATGFSVQYTTADGSATSADGDYITPAAGSTLSFNGTAGEVRQIQILLNGDRKIETDEIFNVLLSNFSNNFNDHLTFFSSAAAGTIINDDNGAITITATGGNETGPVNGGFTFSLPAGYTSDKPITINYTLGGSATRGSDYTVTEINSITIPAGQPSVTLQIAVNDDAIIEGDETISLMAVTISSSYSGVSLNAVIPTVTIADNDEATISLSGPVTLNETASGSTAATFTVTLDKATTSGFSLSYATEDGTALVADNDYISSSGTLSFTGSAGETKTITVMINGDTKVEADETFLLKMFALSNTFSGRLTIPATSTTGTIANDDAATILVTNADGFEGSYNANYTFSLPTGIISDKPVVINYTLSGTAIGGNDHSATVVSSITIPAGQNSVTLTIPVTDDQIVEGSETVILTTGTVTSVYGFVVSNPVVSLNVLDNDNAVLTIDNPVSITEGPAGTSIATFEVKLDKATGGSFTLNFNTVDGTATTANSDYVNETGILSFNGTAGETHTISVTINGDLNIESDEIFSIILGTPSNNFNNRLTVPVTTATGRILNDDGGDITITSGNGVEGGTPGTFTFSFPPGVDSNLPTVIEYTLGGTALAGTDYTGVTSSITIPANTNSFTLTLPVNDDLIVEDDESIELSTGLVSNGLVVSNTFKSLIISDNDVTTLSLNGPVSIAETNSGTTTATFTVTLAKATAKPFSVNYATADGSALFSDNDYIADGKLLNFLGTAGENKTITVVVNGDTKIEANETFTVQLSNLTNHFNNRLTIPVTSSTGTITNDDAGLINITKSGGEEGVKGVTFVFSLSGGVTADVPTVINYNLAGSAIGAGTDYVGAIAGTITILPGENFATLSLPVIDDSILEELETVILTAGTVTTPYGITVTTVPQSVDIKDNDKATLTINSINLNEGDTGPTTAVFSVALSNATGSPFTVKFNTSDGTATNADADYVSKSDILSFDGTAGEVQQIEIVINGDRKIERDEIFNVTLSDLSANYTNRLTIPIPTASATITNDDTSIITIVPENGSETGPAPARFVFNFQPGYSSDQPTTINYTLNGTALNGGVDYTGNTSGTITIPAGVTSFPLELQVNDDNIVEESESISIVTGTVSSIYAISVSNSPQTLSITDNDLATLTLSNDVIITEGNNGTKNAVFTVTLNKPTSSSFTVAYSTSDGTAKIADNDYISASGVLSFAGTANESKTINIIINGDTKIEASELFDLTLSNLSKTFNGQLTIPEVNRTVTIDNDDNAAIIISKANGEEGVQGGSFTFSYPVGMRADIPVVIDYSLAGTATSGVDYSGASSSVTIPAGQNSVTVNFPVTDDDIIEDTETIELVASVATNAYGIATPNTPVSINILDNDTGGLTITAAGITEGDVGAAHTLDFTVTLNKGTKAGFTVAYSTIDGTATIADSDYTATNGTLTFLGVSGETHSISIPVTGDKRIESNETLTVTLKDLSNKFTNRLSLIVPSAIGTINDDDAGIITITKSDGAETGSVPGKFIFSFQAGTVSDKPTTINYTLGGIAGGNGQDYTGPTSGSVVIPANQPSVTLTLPVIDDNIVEGNETVSVTNATSTSVYVGVTMNPAFPTLNIEDNDAAVLSLSNDVAVNEGDDNTVSVTFRLTLDKATNAGFTVGYSTADGTALVSDNDYINASGILNFAGTAGESKDITILVNGDKKIEANEIFNLTVGSLSNTFGDMLTIPVKSRIATIKNDDTGFLTITKTNGQEGSQGGSFIFSFPAGLSTDIPVVINYTLSGTALGGGVDYIGTSPSTITLPAGQNSVTLSLPVIDDNIIEDVETVDIVASTVSNAYGVTVSNPSQSINILDNDDAALTIGSANVTEGDAGTQVLNFTVSLNKATGSGFTVPYTVADGTATLADGDYLAVPSNAALSFAGTAGEVQTISVVINSDRKIEQNETLTVSLKNPSNNFNNRLTVSDPTATGTIINDDSGIITVTSTDGSETGPTAGSFTFSYQTGVTSDQPTTISYTLGGTAGGNGLDYTGITSGSGIIPAGQSSVKLMLPVIDDVIIEDDETVSIAVTSINSLYNSSITLNPVVPTLKIVDNDFASLKILGPVTLPEGNSGNTAFKFEVKLDKGTSSPFTVNYSTSDGSATVLDNDYIPASNLKLNFAGTVGEVQTITILVKGDLKMEPDETFNLILSGLSGTFGNRLKIEGSPAIANIKNDDAGEVIITKIDGTEGFQNGSFIFSFPQGVSSDAATIINYRLGGTATNADYTAPVVGSITIPAGANSVTLVLPVIDDVFLEEPETVTIGIDNISNTNNDVAWSLPIPTVTIFDNDKAELTLTGPAPVVERNSGKTTVTFSVKLNSLTSKGFEVDYSTVNATATVADKDYDFKAGRLSFAGYAGETKEITVEINGDIKVENDETFNLVLESVNPSFAGRLTVLGSPAVATILNDDDAPLARADNATTTEDTPVTFSVVTNDADADGINPKTINLTSLPVKGELKANLDGTVTYTPVPDDFGTYRFTYTVKDNLGLESNEAIVTIVVTPVNDPPVAEDDLFYVSKNVTLRETVAANDKDPDGDVLNFRLLSSPTKGQLQVFNTTDGSFIYTPQDGFKGTDGFTYEINDPAGLKDQAKVTLNVQPNVTVFLTPLLDSITEGDTITVSAQLNEALLQDVKITLDYTGLAEFAKDYNVLPNYQTITIPAGSTSTDQKINIVSVKDYLKEGEEDIRIRIETATPSSFVTIGTGSTIVIKDFYPDDKPVGPGENADIIPDPLTSPNGDGIGNERFVIRNIEKYPDNEVVIFNRWGNEVFRIRGYNNSDKAFAGYANKGVLANTNTTLVDGVYYFLIHTKNSEGKAKLNKGYVIIKR